jgi:hypothetical protein
MKFIFGKTGLEYDKFKFLQPYYKVVFDVNKTFGVNSIKNVGQFIRSFGGSPVKPF